ncbi:hypothetical protein [Flavobacterium sp. MEB061]|jgi:hypothetical protein|uniref:hypothetical protein n=1 Tax=Flavobacterium sp. MEB061 TaxID=1587524 RepID=UPI000AB37BE1|nr:hypothetical protein [Flavobacterium sp. MEB061]
MKKITTLLIVLFLTVTASAQQIGDGYAPMTNDFGGLLKSGVFGGVNHTGGVPDLSYYGHQHLFVVRHENSNNNHQLQIASSFAENDRLFFRKIVGDLTPKNPIWIELATRGTNTFVGNQIIKGTLENYVEVPLNSGTGSYQLINESSGSVISNTVYNRVWLYRDATSDNWWTTRLHDGISIDVSFKTPHVDTRTWWERDPNDNIQSWGNGVDTYLTIDKGNIGIGITNPNNKLDVKGTIHSQEVKVDMKDWSDFVFKKEYNLPTLAEVEKHINEKGHLENIPNEEEVLKNGINLGEMNARLLQKIEELTLYMIDQNKNIQSLIEENKKQNEEIIALKKNTLSK